MGFFEKIFGKKKRGAVPASQPRHVSAEEPRVTPEDPDPASDPNLIKVQDEYGRERFVSRQQWRDSVLMEDLEQHRDHPDALYNVLAQALQAGFAADIVGYAEHLYQTDPITVRGATLLANAYLSLGRLDDAQQVLEAHTAEHGKDAAVLTTLAKVFTLRQDESRAVALLSQALELDPNQEHAFAWYAALLRQRHDEDSEADAYHKIAELQKGWRARVMMARDALQQKDFSTAESLYQEALALAGELVPSDLLMQMSGDLGNNGYLTDILRLVAPHYRAEYHGLQVANNLIMAHVELGHLDQARELMKQLYDQRRPDWKENLDFWETEIARADTATKAAQEQGKPVALAMVSIEGPLWMREGAPFASLLSPKRERAPRIAVFGSTALVGRGDDQPSLEVGDAAGRLSRAVPLMLTELIHLTTDAIGVALIPWAQGRGFALFGSEYADKAICEMAGVGEDAPEYVLGVTLDAREPVWRVDLRLLRGVLATRVAETSFELKIEDQGALIKNLSTVVDDMLATQAGVALAQPPEWYQLPTGPSGAGYLLCLEQQLTLVCRAQQFLEGGELFGEREMLENSFQLCAKQPRNPTVRMLLAQTLRLMQKVRPEILPEYEEKAAHLQRDYPIIHEVGVLVEKALGEAFPH
jgi:tetratricopeptide (TPR) repeat protein